MCDWIQDAKAVKVTARSVAASFCMLSKHLNAARMKSPDLPMANSEDTWEPEEGEGERSTGRCRVGRGGSERWG